MLQTSLHLTHRFQKLVKITKDFTGVRRASKRFSDVVSRPIVSRRLREILNKIHYIIKEKNNRKMLRAYDYFFFLNFLLRYCISIIVYSLHSRRPSHYRLSAHKYVRTKKYFVPWMLLIHLAYPGTVFHHQ